MTLRAADPRVVNIDAEAAILSCLIYDNKRIDRTADLIRAEDFAHELYGRIFAAIVREYSLGRAPNVITLLPYFEEDADFKEAGGRDFLIEIGQSDTGMMNPLGFIEQVANLAARRRLIAGLDQTVARASDPEASVDQLIEAADAAIFDATNQEDSVVQISAGRAAASVIAEMGKPATGALSGIDAIDRVMGLARPKYLVIKASRPGMGKSAEAVSYALGAARRGHGVLYVSLEMSGDDLAARMLADLSYTLSDEPIPFDAINDRTCSGRQIAELNRLQRILDELPIEIVDAGSLTTGRLAMLVRRYKRRFKAKGFKLEIVIADYLQLLRPDRKTDGLNHAVSEVSRSLKAIAKDQNTCMIALAQLNRKVEEREDKRPVLSDLRDSGQIEQDADIIMFLYREEYYLNLAEPHDGPDGKKWQDWAEKLDRARNQIEFIVAKRRSGKTGRATGTFHGDHQAVRG